MAGSVKTLRLLIFFSTTVVLLSSCATERRFELSYSTWVGGPIAEFEHLWGPPKRVFKEDEFTAYEYELWKDCTVYWFCDQTGTIKKWRHAGKGCKMAPFS